MENEEIEFNKICRELLSEIEVNFYSWIQTDIVVDWEPDAGISLYSLSKIIKKTPQETCKYLRKLLILGLIHMGETSILREVDNKDKNIVISLTSLGDETAFDEKMLDDFLPIDEEEIKIDNKKEKLIFKDDMLYLGDKKCQIPKKSSHGRGLSYEYVIIEFIYGKDNKETDWNEIGDNIEPRTKLSKKMRKTIKDAIDRINDRTKKDLDIKALEYSSGVIKALY